MITNRVEDSCCCLVRKEYLQCIILIIDIRYTTINLKISVHEFITFDCGLQSLVV